MTSNNYLRRALGKILSQSDQQQPLLRQRRLFLENLEDRRLLAADLTTFICPAPVAPNGADEAPAVDNGVAIPVFVNGTLTFGDVADTFPYGKDNTFLLASNPTATKTIYLDYDGHHSVNNNWNHNIVFPAFSLDGDTNNFSDAEHSRIQKQFIEVVDDYFPFDVNVTTIDPGVEALRNTGGTDVHWGVRSVNTQVTNGFANAGGIAHLNSFGLNIDDPVFTFNRSISSGGQTNSHEVGHALGLIHDGLGSATYHPGTGSGATSWGPIMGAPFGENMVQWSNGDYADSTTTQNDVNIIRQAANGFDYRGDDHGNAQSTATALTVTTDTIVDGWGIIHERNDVDYFSFTTGAGNVAIQIDPVASRGSLDAEATLYDSQGNQVAISNPTDGINASFNENLAAGEYFIKVDGVGKAGVYSDYGSLGYFEITGTIIKADEPTNEPPTLDSFHPILQIGGDIDGEASNDLSGNSVSLSADGSTVAVGAQYNDGNGNRSGHVRIYNNVTGNWAQIGNDIDGEAAEDQSGNSVSLSADGSIVAIGARYNDGNGDRSGHVRIYHNVAGSWVQIGNDIDGEAGGDQSGISVSLSADGSAIAVGGYRNDGNGDDAGHVRIYNNVAGNWVQIGSDIDGENADDRSGFSVSLSADGTVVGIGTYRNDGNGNESGHVRIYNNVAGSWTQIGSDIDGENADDRSGWSVSLNADGSIVAIGGYRNDGNGDDAGHVRIYNNVAGNWVQIGSDIDGEDEDDESGYSVSLSADGTTVAVGARDNDGNGDGSGHVRIYHNVAGNWEKIGSDINGEAVGDRSGSSVSLSADGSSVAIGAPYNNGNNSGQVQVYQILENNVTLDEDAGEQTINLTGITAGSNENQPLRVTASSSNTGLMADPAVNYTTPNTTGIITIAPLADQSGTTTITVTVEDGGLDNNLTTTADNLTFSRTFDVTINPVNDVPTLDALSDITTDEDTPQQTVNLTGITAGGGETQPLKVTATSSNTNLIADPTITYTTDNSNGSLEFEPLFDQFGTTTITVTVEDGGLDNNLTTAADNLTVSRTFDVTVNPVNDVPTLDALSDITTDEDAPQTVNLTGITAGGGETQTLIVTATSADTNLIPHPSVAYTNGTNVGTINYTPVANQSGTTTVTVTVEDGGLDNNLATSGDNLTVSRTFTVTVDALDDDPPTIASIANVTIDEDATAQTINYNGITAGFNETQTLVVTSTSSNPSLIANPTVTYTSDEQTGSLSFTPLSDQFGSATITVTVEDGGLDDNLATTADNLTATTTFNVVVNPVNDLPLGDTPANISIAEDTPTTVNITGIAAGPNETQVLRLSATSNNPGLIANPTSNYTNGNTTGTINFTPQADQYGTATITVTVEDGGADNNLSTTGDNLTSSSTFDVTVTPVNDAPGQNVIANVTVTEDSPTQSVAISGISAGPNETQPLHITAVSSDPSLFADPSVTYTSGETSGSLSFVPNADQYGTATVTVTIEDGGQDNNLSTAADNLTSSSTFDITVSPENDAPTQNTHADITTAEDATTQSVNITGITAGPNETQVLHVTATSSDSALIANPTVNYTSGDTSSTLIFTPIANQYGTTTVTVTVEDGGADNNLSTTADNLTSSTTFDIVVDPVNDAPGKAATANVTINEDAPSTVAITGINAGPNETEILRITATSSDTTLVPDPSVNYTSGSTNGAVVFTPLTDQYGTATVTVTIEDGGLDNDLSTPADNLTNSSTFDVIVNPVNDVPAGDAIGNVTVDEDATVQTINITGLTAGPNETQPLRVTAASSNAGLLLNPTVNYTSGSQTGALQFTPLTDQYGSSTITVTIEDGGLDNNLATANDNLTSTSTFDITVNPINDAPVGNSIADITVDEDAPTQTISLTGISSGPNESQPLRVTATSSDSTILADPSVSFTTGSDGTLSFTPVAMQDGDVTITVAIEDGGLDNDLSTAADNLTVTRDFDITIIPTLGDYRTPEHKAVILEQVTRLESGVKSFTFTTDTTGYYQVVTATQFATDVQMAMPVIIDALGNTVSSEATGIAAERASMTYNTLLLQPGTYQVEVGSFNGANERMKLSVSMPAVTTSANLNDRAVELTTGAVLQNELGVNGLSSGLFQQMYDVDLSTPIFHQEFDANLDDSLTSFDLKTVRFNVDKSSPSVTLSMNSVASQMAAFAPAVAAVGEMGIADTFGMSIYQNPLSKNDVNGDSQVTPNDALIIINHLNSGATQRLDALQLVDSLNVAGFIDTNGDYNSSPIDVLQVINQLNAMTTDVVVDQGAEGEGFVAAAIHAPMLLQRADTADLHFKNLDVVDPIDVDFGFNLNEQRGRVVPAAATWSAEVDELFGDDDLDDLADQENLVDFSDSISAH